MAELDATVVLTLPTLTDGDRSLKTVIQGYFTDLNQDQSRNTKQCIFKAINQSIKTGETFEIKCLFCVKFTITICDHGPQNQS